MNNKASKATDPCDLERQILDCTIAKNEAEWWANRRIITLEEEAKKTEQFITANDIYIGKLNARLKLLEENALADAITIDTLKEELRGIGEALDDPRVDLIITMIDKIKELQELQCDDKPVAWLHAIRSDSDVITDAVKHLWGQVRQAVGREAQYTIPLYRRKERKKHD